MSQFTALPPKRAYL